MPETKALGDRQLLPRDHPYGKIGPHIAGHIDRADLIAKVEVERVITVDHEMNRRTDELSCPAVAGATPSGVPAPSQRNPNPLCLASEPRSMGSGLATWSGSCRPALTSSPLRRLRKRASRGR